MDASIHTIRTLRLVHNLHASHCIHTEWEYILVVGTCFRVGSSCNAAQLDAIIRFRRRCSEAVCISLTCRLVACSARIAVDRLVHNNMHASPCIRLVLGIVAVHHSLMQKSIPAMYYVTMQAT